MFLAFSLFIFAQASFSSWDLNLNSAQALSTAHLSLGVEECISSPSYLFLLGGPNLVSNLTDFSLRSFYFGGNVVSSLPLKEGALFSISYKNLPALNFSGGYGYLRRDTTQIVDTNGDASPDIIKASKMETDGYGKEFNIKFLFSFQFLGDGYFVGGSFLKDQKTVTKEKPGTLGDPYGYFQYYELNIRYADSSFVNLLVGQGDNVVTEDTNKYGLKLSGGYFLEDSSYVGIDFGYLRLRKSSTADNFFTFTLDQDTTRREKHITVNQWKYDYSSVFEGYNLLLGVNGFFRRPGGERRMGLYYSREVENPDTLWEISMGYNGRFNTTVDTLFSRWESVKVAKKYAVSDKGRRTKFLLGNFSQIFELAEGVKLGVGINGLYQYSYFPQEAFYLDSTEVTWEDGDTVSRDTDDYSRYIYYRMRSSITEEVKRYRFEIPFGVEVAPFNSRKFVLRGGTAVVYEQDDYTIKREDRPEANITDILIRGDSAQVQNSSPLFGIKESKEYSIQNLGTSYYAGVSVFFTNNCEFSLALKIAPDKAKLLRAGFNFKF